MIVYLQYAANSFNIWAENKCLFAYTELFFPSENIIHVLVKMLSQM